MGIDENIVKGTFTFAGLVACVSGLSFSNHAENVPGKIKIISADKAGTKGKTGAASDTM
jgi:hypothetical protein